SGHRCDESASSHEGALLTATSRSFRPLFDGALRDVVTLALYPGIGTVGLDATIHELIRGRM
ncbi:MAG TPA: hypothetical protein VK216_03010, partial [Magnetospirillaceae bacterium]|nr:hypothetical protein [Magnetospirillaceae bacterium]